VAFPPLIIRLLPHSRTPRQTQYTCRLAGRLIQLDALPDALAPFLIHTGIAPTPSDPPPPPVRPESPPIARVRGLINNVARDVTCWAVEDGYRLEVEHGGMFSIDAGRIEDAAGMHITHLSAGDAGLDRGAVVIATIGPALAIALAHHSTYLMHCGAVQMGDGVILFLGDSGAGKSTLSAHLHAAGWPRLGDDGMPIMMQDSGAVVLPHYPQLKLGTHEQYRLDALDHLPIRALYALDSSDASTDPAITPLTYRDAARALIFHTSAVSLFAAPLLIAHAAAMTRIAASVPIKRLIYPHRRDALDQVRALTLGDLA
jgi:hypothetical protein